MPGAIIKFKCSCGTVLSVPAEMAGKAGRCYKCQREVVAPPPRAAAPAAGGAIRFQCPAGHPISVPANLAGRQGICPTCGVDVVIPQGLAAAAAAPFAAAPMADASPAAVRPSPARAAAGDDAGPESAGAPARAPAEEEEEELAGSSKPALAGAPSWLISMGFHTLLLLLLSFIAAASLPEKPPLEVLANIEENKPPDLDFPPPQDAPPVEVTDVPPLPQYAPEFSPMTLDKPTETRVQVETFDAKIDNSAPQGMESQNPIVSTLYNNEAGFLDIMGAGGGGGGGTVGKGGTERFGARTPGTGARTTAIQLHGGSPASEQAVERGLAWLHKHQERDGSWDCGKYGGRKITHPEVKPEDKMAYDVAVTGLAVLAFLGAGHTTNSPKYGQTVKRALYWLEEHQDRKNGRWPGSHYGQGIAALAAAEAFGMGCGFEDMAKRAVDYLHKSQNPEGGWNYDTTNRERNDTSITGWQVMAAKSAKLAGLEVKQELFDGARKHFFSVVPGGEQTGAPADWKIYYARQGNKFFTNPEAGNDAVGAITMLSLLYINLTPSSPIAIKAADYFQERKPDAHNIYYTYYGTLAMFQMGGDYWKSWNKEMRDRLVASQLKGGDDDGSWPYEGDRWGPGGGRVYTTAMSVMTLEVYYRYLPIYKNP